MKKVVTERDRYHIAKLCWDRVKLLPLSRGEKKLLATQLEWDFWAAWRKREAAEP